MPDTPTDLPSLDELWGEAPSPQAERLPSIDELWGPEPKVIRAVPVQPPSVADLPDAVAYPSMDPTQLVDRQPIAPPAPETTLGQKLGYAGLGVARNVARTGQGAAQALGADGLAEELGAMGSTFEQGQRGTLPHFTTVPQGFSETSAGKALNAGAGLVAAAPLITSAPLAGAIPAFAGAGGQMVAQAKADAYEAAKAAGKTESEARDAGNEAAGTAALTLPLYAVAGSAVNAALPAGAGLLTRLGANAAANLTVSAGVRAAEAEANGRPLSDALPTLENAIPDVAFALHGAISHAPAAPVAASPDLPLLETPRGTLRLGPDGLRPATTTELKSAAALGELPARPVKAPAAPAPEPAPVPVEPAPSAPGEVAPAPESAKPFTPPERIDPDAFGRLAGEPVQEGHVPYRDPETLQVFQVPEDFTPEQLQGAVEAVRAEEAAAQRRARLEESDAATMRERFRQTAESLNDPAVRDAVAYEGPRKPSRAPLWENLDLLKERRAQFLEQYAKVTGGAKGAPDPAGERFLAALNERISQLEAPPEPAAEPVAAPVEAPVPEPASSPAPDPVTPQPDAPVSAPAAEPQTPPVATPTRRVMTEPPGDQTSPQNAFVDAARKQRGVEPLESPGRRSWESLVQAAQAEQARNPSAAEALVGELNATGRIISDQETALLAVRQRALTSEYNRLTEARVQANAGGDSAQGQALGDQANAILSRLDETERALRLAGTQQGRSLAARKMALSEDYSVATLASRLMNAKGGEALSKEEVDLVQKTSAGIAEANAKLETRIRELEEQLRQEQAREAVKTAVEEVKAEQKKDARSARKGKPEAPKADPGVLRRILRNQAESARDRIRERWKNSLSDPFFFNIVADLADHTIIGASWLAEGVSELSQWSARMLNEFGESIKDRLPDLRKRSEAWLAAQTEIAPILSRMEGRVKDGDALPQLKAYVRKIAKEYVRAGITDVEGLVGALHRTLEPLFPGLTERQAMDVFSGYGDFRPLSKDAVDTQLRQVRQEAQLAAKLDDALAGTPLKKSGPERQTMSDRARRMQQQLNELKRQGKVTVTDPATQLKSALQQKETALVNRIKDLTREIETGEKTVKTRTPSPENDRTEYLKLLVERLKSTREEIFGKPEATDEQRLQAAMKATERQIAELDRQLKQNDFLPKAKRPKPSSPELDALRAQRDALKAERDELRLLDDQFAAERNARREAQIKADLADLDKRIAAKDLSPRTKASTPKVESAEIEALKAERAAKQKYLNELRREAKRSTSTPEQRAMAAYKKRLATEKAALLDKIAKGDFSKPERNRLDLSKDPEAVRLKAETERIKQEFEKRRLLEERRNRTPGQKALAYAKEALNAPRSILSSMDVSAVLRQGGFITFGNPVRATRSIGAMFRALVSERRAQEIEQSILLRPNAPIYRQAGLYLPHWGEARLSAQEEAYMSELANRIPGVKQSERAYITFLNKLRADSFDAMQAALVRKGAGSPEELKALANYINVATGRGNLGAKAAAAETLATVFFSPRLIASRFQLLLGQPLYGGTMATRRAIALEYARFLAGLGTALGLGAAAGGKIERDRRSSDFGKLRFGDTRIDFLTGLSQNTVLLSRLASGEQKQGNGVVVPIRGDGVPYGGATGWDLIAKFLRAKLAPVPAAVVDTVSGKNAIGEPVTPAQAAGRLVVPLPFKDVYESLQANGVPAGTAVSLLALFGAGVQIYQDQKGDPVEKFRHMPFETAKQVYDATEDPRLRAKMQPMLREKEQYRRTHPKKPNATPAPAY